MRDVWHRTREAPSARSCAWSGHSPFRYLGSLPLCNVHMKNPTVAHPQNSWRSSVFITFRTHFDITGAAQLYIAPIELMTHLSAAVGTLRIHLLLVTYLTAALNIFIAHLSLALIILITHLSALTIITIINRLNVLQRPSHSWPRLTTKAQMLHTRNTS